MSYTFTLTGDDKARLAAVRDSWLADAGSTERCDRPAVEARVAAAYTSAGLAPPPTTIWMESPFGGALAAYGLRHGVSAGALRRLVVGDVPAPVLDRVEADLRRHLPDGPDDLPDDGRGDLDAVRAEMLDVFYHTQPPSEPLWDPLWRNLQSRLEDHLGGPLSDPWGVEEESDAAEMWSELRTRMRPVRDRLGDTLGGAVAASLLRDLQQQLPQDVRRKLRSAVTDVTGVTPDPDSVRFWNAFGGQLDPWGDAHFLAVFTAALPLAGLDPSPRLDALVAAVRSLGWWWPGTDAVVLTDRPTELRRKASGKLTALAYADGYRVAGRRGNAGAIG